MLHAGLAIEAAGLLAQYLVFHLAGAGVGTLDLLGPMVAGGIGMGMVFVPLFDIVMAGVAPHEMGSASGVLQSVNSMGMALGVAGIGALFFALLGPARAPRAFVHPAEWIFLVTVVLLGLAFVTAFWLPRRPREAAPVAAPAGAADVTASALADAA